MSTDNPGLQEVLLALAQSCVLGITAWRVLGVVGHLRPSGRCSIAGKGRTARNMSDTSLQDQLEAALAEEEVRGEPNRA